MSRRAIMIVLILIVITLVAMWGFWFKGELGSKTAGNFAYPPTKVAVAPVTLTKVPRIIRGIGQLEAGQQVAISAENSGQITHIFFDSGDYVAQGDLLIQLNDAVERAEKLRLEAQLRNAELQLGRFTLLAKENASSKEKRDNALTERDMTIGEIEKIEAEIAQKAIRAPFSGKLGIRKVHLGDYLQSGEPIINLVNQERINLNFSLDEKALPALSIGQAVDLQVDAYPDLTFKATIKTIEPIIGATRTIQIQALIAPPHDQLRAGMFAKVEVLKADEAALTVPETSITYTAYGNTIFIMSQNDSGDQIVTRRSVTIGEHWDGKVEVISGVEAGEKVVTSGQMKLQEGMRVEPLPSDTLNDSSIHDSLTNDTNSAKEPI